jgi:hypothetical protein
MSSYITKQSAVAADAFLSASHKKGRVKQAIKGNLPLVPEEGGPSSDSYATSSDSRSESISRCDQVLRPGKNDRSAMSVLQDVLLGRGPRD